MLIFFTADFDCVTKKSCAPKIEQESLCQFFVGESVTPRPWSHQAPRSVTVQVLLLVGIVRVRFLYLNPKICKYQILNTDILSPVEKGMHTNGFRYKKCTHLTVGTGNVYLNPG